MNVITLMILFTNIAITLALPTKHFTYSLLLQKPFHSFNDESVKFTNNELVVTPSDGQRWQGESENVFTALMEPSGIFNFGEKVLSSVKGGLTLEDRATAQAEEDMMSNSVFSIKQGTLCQDGSCFFTLCPVKDSDHGTSSSYSIHNPQSESSNCEGHIKGVKLAVINQLGMQAKDHEAPEFMYITGRKMFI